METRPSAKERIYLPLAQLAAQMGLSPRTVGRYRSEYAPYLNPYAPPGDGRGLKPEAQEVLTLIHELKTHRAHWTEIKQQLDAKFSPAAPTAAFPGSKAFQRSLDAIRQSHQLMASDLRLLFAEVNQRLDRLEASVRQLQALMPLPQRLAEERSERQTALTHTKKMIERQEQQIQQLKKRLPKTESLFPESDSPSAEESLSD